MKNGDCGSRNIIGDNTGVYVGGLPKDIVIQRVEADTRAQVPTCRMEVFGSLWPCFMACNGVRTEKAEHLMIVLTASLCLC